MASLTDSQVSALIGAPNFATVSTLNGDGSILNAVAWISLEDGELAVNSADGRQWPANLDRDGRITALVYDQSNPYEYVEIRGTATGGREDADDLRAFVAGRLARFKVPDEVVFREAPLPRTATGKVLKRELREAAMR